MFLPFRSPTCSCNLVTLRTTADKGSAVLWDISRSDDFLYIGSAYSHENELNNYSIVRKSLLRYFLFGNFNLPLIHFGINPFHRAWGGTFEGDPIFFGIKQAFER